MSARAVGYWALLTLPVIVAALVLKARYADITWGNVALVVAAGAVVAVLLTWRRERSS